MKGFFDGTFNKFLVSIMGAITTSLTVYYGTTKWEPVVLLVLTALGTYLVPNTSSSKAAARKPPADDPKPSPEPVSPAIDPHSV